MSDTLHVDLEEVRRIATGVLDAATALSDVARHLRLRMCAPATDAVSMALCARANAERLRLGLVGEAAADELVRMAEVLIAYAYNTKDLVRHVQQGVTGLTSHALATDLDVSGPLTRAQPTPRSIPTPPPKARPTDHEVLSFAVMVASGDAEPDRGRSDLSHVRAEAARLAHLARDLRAAMSTGDRPANAFTRFSAWVMEHYLEAVIALEAEVDAWIDSYVLTRQRVGASAVAYTSWLAAVVSQGEAADVPAGDARAAFDSYVQVVVGVGEFESYPQMGSAPRRESAAAE
ncbi:hypothetical protein MycrhDRAFT_5715 [Mycolicibacterium rhodesiae JS60]|nr:hypothetical protein MycrhDRAFT_5715 [Mycolicibacterium rhodesiae JS60]